MRKEVSMLVAENGVLGVEVLNRSEAIDDALYELECTEEYNKIWKEYLKTKNEKYYDELFKMENDYLRAKGFYK